MLVKARKSGHRFWNRGHQALGEMVLIRSREENTPLYLCPYSLYNLQTPSLSGGGGGGVGGGGVVGVGVQFLCTKLFHQHMPQYLQPHITHSNRSDIKNTRCSAKTAPQLVYSHNVTNHHCITKFFSSSIKQQNYCRGLRFQHKKVTVICSTVEKLFTKSDY